MEPFGPPEDVTPNVKGIDIWQRPWGKNQQNQKLHSQKLLAVKATRPLVPIAGEWMLILMIIGNLTHLSVSDMHPISHPQGLHLWPEFGREPLRQFWESPVKRDNSSNQKKMGVHPPPEVNTPKSSSRHR